MSRVVPIKILAFSSIRADYDLMTPLYFKLMREKNTVFKLMVSGAHLSSDYGYTVNDIKADGMDILAKVETLLNSDSTISKLKTASIFLQSAMERVADFKPNVILIAGDREDMMMAALMATFLKIPLIHFYGGDHETAGHEDTQIRHAISKLASCHFVSCLEHENRLLAMGESPKRIFNIGSIALDKFKNLTLTPIVKILKKLSVDSSVAANKKIALVIYHPSPDLDEQKNSAKVLKNILDELIEQNMLAFVSSPNTDAGNKKLLNMSEQFQNQKNIVWYKNLPRQEFLSLFCQSHCIIGNSSAGLLEAGTIPIAAINVGYRQANRLSGDNVIFCSTGREDISKALLETLTVGFQENIKRMKNPYGDGESSDRALKLIQELNFDELLFKTEDPLDKCYV